jgi:hypothetical protein
MVGPMLGVAHFTVPHGIVAGYSLNHLRKTKVRARGQRAYTHMTIKFALLFSTKLERCLIIYAMLKHLCCFT